VWAYSLPSRIEVPNLLKHVFFFVCVCVCVCVWKETERYIGAEVERSLCVAKIITL